MNRHRLADEERAVRHALELETDKAEEATVSGGETFEDERLAAKVARMNMLQTSSTACFRKIFSKSPSDSQEAEQEQPTADSPEKGV
ncbi:uncharacterized protein RHO25_013170 [Cercospora beticola]|uniref:Uncharacterized protein n=1 Tax=Cercospora beticola TaxID=122368 RepID=A0ABZ0P9G2_CERBT|nr:hypothetical protein RHO25_013170 [Cercospora beticola]